MQNENKLKTHFQKLNHVDFYKSEYNKIIMFLLPKYINYFYA